MSKAFVRDSDGDREPDLPSVRPALPPGTKNYVTRAGAERFRNRLADLIELRRRLLSLDAAADPLSETDQRRLDTDIRKIQTILDSLVIAEPPPNPEKIAFGATVEILDTNGEVDTCQIVGVDEAAPEYGRISWISPLARALLSHKSGDKIQFRSPSGTREIAILTVRYD